MKRFITAITFFAVSSLLAIVPVVAQERAISAKVPFDFVVGDRMLPSGLYRITSVDNTFQVLIDSKGQQSAMFAMGYPSERAANGESKLVFGKVGHQYFLKSIVSMSLSKSLDFPKSKAEKKAQRLEGSLGEEYTTSALVY